MEFFAELSYARRSNREMFTEVTANENMTAVMATIIPNRLLGNQPPNHRARPCWLILWCAGIEKSRGPKTVRVTDEDGNVSERGEL